MNKASIPRSGTPPTRDRLHLRSIDGGIAARVAASPRVGRRAAALTDRERQVIALVAVGKRNGEIAADLRISVETVKKHLSNVFQKLQIRHRVELVLIALRQELANATPAGTGPRACMEPSLPQQRRIAP